MFDDFDLKVNVEEISGYDEEEAFATWYEEDFHAYCDELQKHSHNSFYRNNPDEFNEN